METNPADEGPLGPVGFVKRKRNLLVISVLLTAGLWVGITSDSLKEITFIFFKFSPENPERIAHVAWFIWGICLIRYVGIQQQWPLVQQSSLTNYFKSCLNSNYEPIIRLEMQKQGKSPEADYTVAFYQTTFFGTSCYYRLKLIKETTSWEKITPTKISTRPTAIWHARIKVLGRTFYWTVFTSEYYLPYLIALLPVVIVVQKEVSMMIHQ